MLRNSLFPKARVKSASKSLARANVSVEKINLNARGVETYLVTRDKVWFTSNFPLFCNWCLN